MRIAAWHNLPSGGGLRAFNDHLTGLVRRGHEVELWTPPTADRRFARLDVNIPTHVVSLRIVKGRRLSKAITRSASELLWTLASMDEHCAAVAGLINDGSFDVVFVGACAAIRTASIGRYLNSPSVLYLQEPFRPLYEAMPLLVWEARDAGGISIAERVKDLDMCRARRVQVREERISALAYHRILVNSHFSRESVARAYGLDASVCYLGVDLSRFVNMHEERDHSVIGIGALVREKRIEFVLEAIARMRAPRPVVRWIGNVADPAYLSELGRLADSASVKFDPRVGVSDEEVVRLLNTSAVFAYAPRLEPFGYAPLEAGACGVPVVAIAEGGLRETVVDGVTGFLVENPEEMAVRLQRLLDDPEFANQMGLSAEAHVRTMWSLSDGVDRLERHLEGLASRAEAEKNS